MHELTHWGRVTHICVSRLTFTGSGNGLSPGRRQAIIRTNAGMLLIGPLGTNFSENLIEILTSSFTKMRNLESVVCEMAAILSRPQCVKLYVNSKGAAAAIMALTRIYSMQASHTKACLIMLILSPCNSMSMTSVFTGLCNYVACSQCSACSVLFHHLCETEIWYKYILVLINNYSVHSRSCFFSRSFLEVCHMRGWVGNIIQVTHNNHLTPTDLLNVDLTSE